jgi:hypothetical protein
LPIHANFICRSAGALYCLGVFFYKYITPSGLRNR